MLSAEDIRARLRGAQRTPERDRTTHEGLLPSAVLVPLVAAPDGMQLLLTRRTDTVETHKGHIAFPGGMADEEDADRIETALRETREELGIDSHAIEVVGLLDDFATPTGFIITPVVGVFHVLPQLFPNVAEVAEVFLVPLSFFLDERNCAREQRMTDYGLRHTWRFDYEGRVIWGATAAIIRDLIIRLR